MEKGAINHSSFAFLIDFRGLYLMAERKEKMLCPASLLLILQSSIDPTAPAKLKANPIKEKGIRNGGEGVFEAH
jgi:hypothetical protein